MIEDVCFYNRSSSKLLHWRKKSEIMKRKGFFFCDPEGILLDNYVSRDQ